MPIFPVYLTTRGERGKKETKTHNIKANDKVEAYEWGERQMKANGVTEGGVVEVGGTNASATQVTDML